MSEPTADLRITLTRRGASVRRAGRLPLLLAAADLPDGGMIALDLQAPSTVSVLFLTEAHWAALDESTEDLDALESRLAGRFRAGDLPPVWLRLAFVTGVARWYPERLDERLIAVDLASALAATGQHEEAASHWDRGREAALALLDGPLSVAAHRELSLALERLEPGTHALPTPSTELPLLEQARGGGRGLRSVPALPDPRRPRLDPRNVPSRVVDGPVSASLRNGAVVVHGSAFDGGLVADDLQVVAYEGDLADPRRVATIPWTFDGSAYRGEIRGELVERWRAGKVVLEARSAASPHGPLLDDGAAAEVADQQAAFARVRNTRRVVGQHEVDHTRLLLAEAAS